MASLRVNAPLTSLNFAGPQDPNEQDLNLSLLAGTSWDGSLMIWNVNDEGNRRVGIRPVGEMKRAGGPPLLDAAWSADGSAIVSAGCDGGIDLCMLSNGSIMRLGSHTGGPAKCVERVGVEGVFVSGGLADRCVRFWDARSPNGMVGAVEMPERVYDMSYCAGNLLVACAERSVHIVDPRSARIQWSGHSNLSYQTRCCAISPKGFVTASVNGGVGVTFRGEEGVVPDPSKRTKNFNFSSQTKTAVNALGFRGFFAPALLATAEESGDVVVWSIEWKTKQVSYEGSKSGARGPATCLSVCTSSRMPFVAAARLENPVDPNGPLRGRSVTQGTCLVSVVALSRDEQTRPKH